MKALGVWAGGVKLAMTGLAVAGYLVTKALLEGSAPLRRTGA
ncbi:hypothetical protein ABT160_20595 [Streptomyces sp. NPDC001941]